MSILGHCLSGPRVSQQEANCPTECVVLGTKAHFLFVVVVLAGIASFPQQPMCDSGATVHVCSRMDIPGGIQFPI